MTEPNARPLPYAAVPRRVGWTVESGVIEAVVPVLASDERHAAWLLGRASWPWLVGLAIGIAVVAFDVAAAIKRAGVHPLWASALLVLGLAVVCLACVFLAGIVHLRKRPPGRVRLEVDELIVSDLNGRRLRRWPRSKVVRFGVRPIGRSGFGRLQVRLTAGNRVEVGLAKATSLAPVAAAFNSALRT